MILNALFVVSCLLSLILLIVIFVIRINSELNCANKLTIGHILLGLVIFFIPIVNIAYFLNVMIMLICEYDIKPINEFRPKIFRSIIKFLNKEIKI